MVDWFGQTRERTGPVPERVQEVSTTPAPDTVFPFLPGLPSYPWLRFFPGPLPPPFLPPPLNGRSIDKSLT